MPLILTLFLVILALAWLGIVFFGPPYVPTHRRQLRKLLDELRLSPRDHVVDLGAGDGQVLVEVARRGATASGVELNPFLVLLAKWRLRRYSTAKINFGNLWNYQLPEDTSYIFVFFAGGFMAKLEQYITNNKTKNPLRVISYGFRFEDRRPIKTIGAFYIYEF